LKREGCVVKPLTPRRDPECGRVILKLVSVDYLERKKKGKQANCAKNTESV
jgi:hypothetical protein